MFWIRIQWNPDPANTFRIRSPWIRRGSGFAETGSGSRGPLNPVPDPKHWFWQTVRIRIQIYGCIRIRIKHKRSRNAGCFLFVSHHYWRVSMDPDPHWSPMRNLVSNFNYANLNYRFFSQHYLISRIFRSGSIKKLCIRFRILNSTFITFNVVKKEDRINWFTIDCIILPHTNVVEKGA